MKKIERELISVFDKTGVLDFVKTLVEDFKVEILSTGGTGRLLEQNGVDIIKISNYTESPEMFDGRVKTLHPRIEGGILYRRSLEKDVKDAEKYNVKPIDMVVCNLYQFKEAIYQVMVTLNYFLHQDYRCNFVMLVRKDSRITSYPDFCPILPEEIYFALAIVLGKDHVENFREVLFGFIIQEFVDPNSCHLIGSISQYAAH